jgi:hypothetical protein
MRGSPVRVLSGALLGLASVALLIGCEALVDGELGTVGCEAEGMVGPPACPDGLVCRAGICSQEQWGASCSVDADCLPTEFCFEPTSFGGEGAPRCSRVCCSSADCAPDDTSVCWAAPAGGGSFCMAASDVGRGPPGAGGPLTPCESDADCRSGLCRHLLR